MMRPIFRRSTLAAACFLVGFTGTLARAQDPPATPTIPADVQKTLSQVADLDLLSALAPLKLTQSQINKLLEPLKGIARDDETARKKDYDTVRKLTAEVEKARAGLLKGEALDTDLEARLQRVNADMASRYDDSHRDAVSRISAIFKDTLTETQAAAVQARFMKFLKDTKSKLSIPGRLQNNQAKTNEFIRDAAINWYSDRILLTEKAITLLTALRPNAPTSSDGVATAASSSTTSTTGAGNTTTNENPPRP